MRKYWGLLIRPDGDKFRRRTKQGQGLDTSWGARLVAKGSRGEREIVFVRSSRSIEHVKTQYSGRFICPENGRWKLVEFCNIIISQAVVAIFFVNSARTRFHLLLQSWSIVILYILWKVVDFSLRSDICLSTFLSTAASFSF